MRGHRQRPGREGFFFKILVWVFGFDRLITIVFSTGYELVVFSHDVNARVFSVLR